MKKILSLLFLLTIPLCPKNTPTLTVIFVIDQFAYHYIDKIYPNLNYGLKKLIDNGVVFTEAYFPHAQPGTATGHTCINCGVLPKDHGIIANKWLDNNGKLVKAYYDNSSNALVFNQKYGYSAKHVMVPGISDSIVLENNKVFALSLKARAAIGLAGKLGKAIWLDEKDGNFTSSKQFFNKLPQWIRNFNQNTIFKKDNILTWKTFYPEDSKAYKFENIRNYQFSSSPPMINTTFKAYTLGKPSHEEKTNLSYETCLKTPEANLMLMELAQKCLDNNFNKETDKKIVLFISISSLDKVGHAYGPESMEAIDLLYYIDYQIDGFMKYIEKQIDKKNILYVLSADHGVMPISELLAAKGIKTKRIDTEQLVNDLNNLIKEQFGLNNVVLKYKEPNIYLNQKLIKKNEKKFYKTLKDFLQKQDWIKNVWTAKELEAKVFEPNSIESLFKTQFYKGRSGQLIIQTHPYINITNYPKGTNHNTPYNYDTHVPLIFYQHAYLEKQKITSKVLMTQVAPTLAFLLNVKKPVACTYEKLPLSIYKR